MGFLFVLKPGAAWDGWVEGVWLFDTLYKFVVRPTYAP
jgi:hypothetical protein